jgi:thiamine-phosphate pyrophosphorylase
MLLYYITDRTQLAADEPDRRAKLLARIAEAARCGVDYVQLRERDLAARDLESLAREALRAVRDHSSRTKLLINSRTDVALAVGADGVHLRSDDVSASDTRALLARAGGAQTLVAVSCHTVTEVVRAEAGGASFAVFGPIFQKPGGEDVAAGLDTLREVCDRTALTVKRMPVLALGGVTVQNAAQCVKAGAAGVAGIRLFQQGSVAETVVALQEFGLGNGPPDVSNTRGAAALGRGFSPIAAVLDREAQPAPRYSYRRRLPHLQRDYKALFVTFRTYGKWRLPEPARSIVLEHCLHEHQVTVDMHAVVVMPDHVHLLYTALLLEQRPPISLPEIMHSIKGGSAHAVNKFLGRKGHVWQEEFFDHVLRSSESCKEKAGYIWMNPVRAGLVERPQDYPWNWRAEEE